MFRDEAAILAYEAKRRPELADLLDRIETVTIDELDAANLPRNLRVAVINRQKAAREALAIQYIEAALSSHAVEGRNPDPLGDLIQWTSDEQFVQVDRGGHLLVKYQQPLWLPISGGVWIGSAFSQYIDPAVLLCSARLRTATRSEYLAAKSEWANGQADTNDQVIDLTDASAGSQSNLAALGVRFSR